MTSPAPALHSTLGAVQIGIIISVCLYGVLCVQAFTYYQAGFKDSLHTRLLVVWCLIVETIHTIFITIYLYQVTVGHFGDYGYLPGAHWPLVFSVFISSLLSAPVQVFFALRVFVLSKNRYLFAASAFASIVCVALSLLNAILAERGPTLIIFQEKYLSLATWNIGFGGVINSVNTATLCYYLLKGKSKINRSRMIIDKLVTWTIETGLLTSLCSVLGVAFILSMKHNFIWVCPLIFSAKLYSNSFYATLNGRLSLRASGSGGITIGSFQPSHGCSCQTRIEIIRVHGQTETSVLYDSRDRGPSHIVKMERTTPGNYDGMDSENTVEHLSPKDLGPGSRSGHV
ncbi:hypothetical protein BDZ94DRAFT_1275250 [Collybia nuda]|uniref:DUF6534 domain-containing protein n=1 Tax=Collybia nuda TaxID=64659 RepID=A0A9P5XU31_9AGAR|nr:hypothetical protein BDZ94DRAFT_1275250 [Collybia nuda]